MEAGFLKSLMSPQSSCLLVIKQFGAHTSGKLLILITLRRVDKALVDSHDHFFWRRASEVLMLFGKLGASITTAQAL